MDVANEILDAIEIVADKKIREQTTQIYPGICKSVNGNSCVMSINGKDNTVQFYGSAPNVGAIYRVFVPYDNMSMAFIITTNGSGSSAFGVSSVNGLTGDVNLTASDVGAAPAGYGLGTTPKMITDWNDAKLDGWYCSDIGAANAPDSTIGCFGRVDNHGNPEVCVQEVWGLANINAYYHWIRLVYPGTGNGTPWEWVNPPMVLGIEYRTTERYLGNPVYKKMDSDGVIWWSTDQSTWKCEAERVGAYSKTETDTLLQNKADTSSVYTKTESDVLLQKKVNPNLLDNWYFLNPVNQRGVTSGNTTHNVYFIDRWITTYGTNEGTYSLDTDGITLTTYTDDSCSMFQRFENVSELDGKILTASVLLSDGTLFSGTITRINGSLQWFHNRYSIALYLNSNNDFYITAYAPRTITAVKLELGSQQTLAHQDENGNWVLNEIPDYGEQLRRCQRYYYKDTMNIGMDASGVYSNQNRALLHFPQTMRAVPSISVTPASGYAAPNALVLSPNEVLLYTASDVNWGLQILEATADL